MLCIAFLQRLFYSLLQHEKRTCYPRRESITVTESGASINLQDLLDLTVSRLAKFLEETLDALTREERSSLKMISKWGCDGSFQANFRQEFKVCGDSDGNVFQTTVVPLLLFVDKSGKQETVWRNVSIQSSLLPTIAFSIRKRNSSNSHRGDEYCEGTDRGFKSITGSLQRQRRQS